MSGPLPCATGEIGVVVAELDGALVGYCFHHFGYETAYAASGLYIVDLYAVESHRPRESPGR